MKTNLILLTGFLILLLAACVPDLTTTPVPTSDPLLNESLPGSIEISLRIVRQGKLYPVVLGHDLGEAFFKTSPRPEIPDWYLYDRNMFYSNLEWYGDLDKDGEIEYLVTYSSRAAGCYKGVLAVDYDAEKDQYRVFDELAGPCDVIGTLEDLDKDGIPELRAKNTDLFYDMGVGGDSGFYSPIQIYRFDGRSFSVVTSEYPALIEEDVQYWLKRLKSRNDGQKDLILAAYLADMIALGREKEGIREYDKLCAEYGITKHRRPEGRTCDTVLYQILEAINNP